MLATVFRVAPALHYFRPSALGHPEAAAEIYAARIAYSWRSGVVSVP